MGQIVLGLGLLFIGMNTMSSAVEPLKDLPEFQSVFTAFSNPLLGVAVGAAVTALLQSSSASMGILQAISTTGVVSFNIAMPLIMGQNIGTCITALISSVGASKNAKRTAMIHLFFNIIGSVFFLVVLYAGNALFRFPFWENTMDMGSIANLHLAFNIACTALLLPFHRQLVKLVKAVVPGDAEERELSVLDDRFLSSPSLALEKSHDAVVQMGEFARDNFLLSVDLIKKFDPKKLELEIQRLMGDEDVTRKSGIYEYLLTGDERKLSIRTFDRRDAQAAYERQGHKCAICGETFDFDDMHADHIKAWSKGGHTTPDNCQMLCRDCNLRKGAQ